MRYAPLLVLLAAGVAACDSTEPPKALTEPETDALLHEIVDLVTVRGGTVHCSIGGEATVTAVIDEQEDGDSAWNSRRWTIVPDDCAVDVVTDSLTLNGKPDLSFTVNAWVVYDDDEIVKGEFKIAMSGAMTWRRRNGDSDVCPVDLAYESTDWYRNGFTDLMTGRMCSLDLSIDVYGLLF